MTDLSTPRPRTVTIREIDGLRAHAEAWDRLGWSSPQALPSLLPDWAIAFFRTRVAPQETWSCSFAYLGDELVGVLPIVAKPHPVFGLGRPRLQTPFDNLTNSGDVPLSVEHGAWAFAALLQEIGRQYPGYLELTLPAVRWNSPVWGALDAGLPDHRAMKGLTHRYSMFDLGIGSKAYLDSLGSLKSNLKRYRRKLDGRGPVTVEMQAGAAANPAFLGEFLRLEASGWKGRNGSAILNRPSETAFYETLVETFAAKDRLEWHIVRVADRVVAAEMGIRCGRSLFLPRMAFDETFSDCMPGTLLTGEVNAAAFERSDIGELNHLSDAPWQRNWRMARDEYRTIHLVRRSVFATLFHRPLVASGLYWQTELKPRMSPRLKGHIKSLMKKLPKRKRDANLQAPPQDAPK